MPQLLFQDRRDMKRASVGLLTHYLVVDLRRTLDAKTSLRLLTQKQISEAQCQDFDHKKSTYKLRKPVAYPQTCRHSDVISVGNLHVRCTVGYLKRDDAGVKGCWWQLNTVRTTSVDYYVS